MRGLYLLGLLLSAAGLLSAAPKPNVLLILTDDLGWGDLSLSGEAAQQPRISTPRLAEMAQTGVQLSRHYTAAPVCAPARASLFSGVHQGHAEVVRNNNFDAALENSHTLAGVLKQAGYATALIGKWGIAGGQEGGGTPQSCPAWPTKRGFDYFFGYANHIAGHRHYPKEEPGADRSGNVVWDGERAVTGELDNCYSTDLFTARAKKWIAETRRAHPQQPFFLALTLTAPHARLALPACPYPPGGGLHGGVQWLGRPHAMINTATQGAWDSYVEPAYRRWGNSAAAPPRHATMVARVDAAVGDLLQLCRDLGIERNTLVVFTSDNGPHNEPGAVPASPGHPAPAQDPAFFRSFGPLDGIKRDVLEGGLRVPCLVWGPGLIRRGAVSTEPSQFQDWMATFADLAGLPKPMRCDGVSLLPLLRGEQEHLSGNIVYSEYFFAGHTPRYPGFAPGRDKHPRGEQQVLYFRDEEGRSLKAIRCGIRTGEEDFEIYDTLADSHEAQNLAPRYAALMPELRRAVLYARRPYDYVRDPAAGARRNPCRAARCYDKLPVPAEEVTAHAPGWEMRCVAGSTPWVPEFDTLPQAAAAKQRVVSAPGEAELPSGSITEFRGYLRIPRDGLWRFALRTSAAAGSRAYMRMHRFALIDADASYRPGTWASSSACPNAEEAAPESGQGGLRLSAGLHAVCLTVVQGSSSSGHVQLTWQCGDAPVEPIPPNAYLHASRDQE